jgi:hypothetical protein
LSDIGILNDPISQIVIVLIFGSPGLLLGAIPGALLWRRHCIAVPSSAPLSASSFGWWGGWLSKA